MVGSLPPNTLRHARSAHRRLFAVKERAMGPLKSSRCKQYSSTGALGRRWGWPLAAGSPAPTSPDSDSPLGAEVLRVSTVRGRRCVGGLGSGAPEVVRGPVWLLAHTGRTAVAGSGQQTVWARWSVGVGMVWVARLAGEGKQRRWRHSQQSIRKTHTSATRPSW